MLLYILVAALYFNVMFVILKKTDEDFTAGRYDVTILPGTTRAAANIPVLLDKIIEEAEYFTIHLYIPSETYELGIQQGSIINARASIIDIGILPL